MINKQEKKFNSLIIHSNVISDVLGSSRTYNPTIILNESDKTKIIPELIKDNILFRDMCFYIFANSLVADIKVQKVEQSLPKILQINKRGIELFLDEVKNIDSETSSLNVESIERTFNTFEDVEYDSYKKEFVNKLKEVNLEDFFKYIIGKDDNQISKSSLKDIFNETSFKDFLKSLENNPIDNTVTFMDLEKNTKLRDYLSGQKGRYGKQEKRTSLKTRTEGFDNFNVNVDITEDFNPTKNKGLKDYIAYVKTIKDDEGFRDRLEETFTINEDILNDHLSVLGRFQTNSPLLFDSIMKYITVETNVDADEEGAIELSEKVIQFNQVGYLREIFLNFGLGDIEKENFELVSDIKIRKQDDASTFFEGIQSTEKGKSRTSLMFISPKFKKKKSGEQTRDIENIELVGNKNRKEFDFENEISGLASEINDIKDSFTKEKLKETIEYLLFKNLNTNIPLTQLIMDTITPMDGKIVCGKFSILLSKNDAIFRAAKDTKNLKNYLQQKFDRDSIYMKETELDKKTTKLQNAYNNFEIMMNTNDASKLMGRVEKIKLKKNFFVDSPRIRKPKKEKEDEDLEYELVKDAYIKLNFTEILIKLFQKKVPIPIIIGGTMKFNESVTDQMRRRVRGLGPDDTTTNVKTAIENYILVLERINIFSEKENTKLKQFINLLKQINSEISTKKGDFSSQKQSNALVFFNLYSEKLETNLGITSKKEVDIDFETLSQEARKQQGTKLSMIPIIIYKDFKFEKEGTVNAKQFAFKMGYRPKTATEEKEESKQGRANRSKGGEKSTIKVDVKINRFLNTLVKNFKKLEGWV